MLRTKRGTKHAGVEPLGVGVEILRVTIMILGDLTRRAVVASAHYGLDFFRIKITPFSVPFLADFGGVPFQYKPHRRNSPYMLSLSKYNIQDHVHQREGYLEDKSKSEKKHTHNQPIQIRGIRNISSQHNVRLTRP